MDKRIFLLREYIAENLHREVSVQQLADKLNLSMSHFSTLFKKEIGLSPNRYIIDLRLEEARKLLESEDFMSIKQIAFRVGFQDQSRFIREFKKKYNSTPKKYRNQQWAEQLTELNRNR